MLPPSEPDKEDCCNNGCNPCIFEVYEKQLQLYRDYIQNGKIGKSHENGISELCSKDFKVVYNAETCKSHNIICFQLNNIDLKTQSIWWKPGQHFILKCLLNGKSVSRAYTPLKLSNIRECDFSIIVKRYENGIISNYLCDLPVGSCTLWRGPYGCYKYVVNRYLRIIMVAQGTGVAPFYSIIENILNNEEDDTRITLLLSCRSISGVPLRNELYDFRNYWNYDYKIFISSALENFDGSNSVKYREPVILRKLCYNDITTLTPKFESDQFLICGSSRFIDYYKEQLLLFKHVPEQNIVLF